MVGEYNFEAVKKLISDYSQKGLVYELGNAGVGFGTVILYNDGDEHLYNFIIKEVYLNEWSSTHTVRRYSKLPNKYMEVIRRLENDNN